MTSKNFKFIGDRENSPYRHIIHLKPEHQRNGVTQLAGYCKHKHHEGSMDQMKGFTDYVSRIVCSQLYKASAIEFYTHRKKGKENDTILCYVTHKNFHLDEKTFSKVEPLRNFLQRTVTSAITEPQKKPKLIHTQADEKRFFPYEKSRFASQKELADYCSKLIEQDFSRGRVEGYFYDYIQKNELYS